MYQLHCVAAQVALRYLIKQQAFADVTLFQCFAHQFKEKSFLGRVGVRCIGPGKPVVTEQRPAGTSEPVTGGKQLESVRRTVVNF